MSECRIRIPRSAFRRNGIGYAKLIHDIEPLALTAFDIHGTLIRVGSWVTEADLWPTPDYPKPALLLEYAGNPKPARGHNRHGQEDVWILWRYRPGAGEWEELARCALVAHCWVPHMAPIIRAALAEGRGPQQSADLAAVESRIAAFLDAEMRRLNPREASRVLSAVHDQLAARFCGVSLQAA